MLGNYVSGNVDARLLSKYDYVYGGDVKQWVKFANTLRLRLAMRVAYADATLARQEAEKSVQNMYGLREYCRSCAIIPQYIGIPSSAA